MKKRLLGNEHPSVAASLNNLAELYRQQGQYSQAESLSLEALEMRKHLLGEKHPHVALSINNLAKICESEGRYEKAEPLYEEALVIAEKVLGENHPQTKKIRENYQDLQNRL